MSNSWREEELAILIRSHHADFVDAGRWLSETFSAEAIQRRFEGRLRKVKDENTRIRGRNKLARARHVRRKKEMSRKLEATRRKEVKAQLEHLLPLMDNTAFVRGEKPELVLPPARLDPDELSISGRFFLAVEYVRGDDRLAGYGPFEDCPFEQSSRSAMPPDFDNLDAKDRLFWAQVILLMTWLATDPEADQTSFQLTSFQDWPWMKPGSASGNRPRGYYPDRDEAPEPDRRLARDVIENDGFLPDDPDHPGVWDDSNRWLELFKRAWQQVVEVIPVRDDPPKPYRKADLKRMAGTSPKTLAKYGKAALGKERWLRKCARDAEFSHSEAEQVLNYIADHTTDQGMKKTCRESLYKLLKEGGIKA